MTPAKRARMVMVAAYMGALGTVLAALAILLHWPYFFRGFPVGLLVASLFILLNRSLRDEYFQELWAAGTSWAFVAVIAWTIGVPIYLGTFVGSREHAWLADIPANWTFIVALAAFFTGFHAKRLRGAA